MTNKPWYQTLIVYLSFVLAGIFVFGAFLDSIVNSISIITFKISIWGSTLLILFWLIIETYVYFKKPRWLSESRSPVRIKQIGIKIRLGLVGVLFLLWLPTIKENLGGVEINEEEIAEKKANKSTNYYKDSKSAIRKIDKDILKKIDFDYTTEYIYSTFGVPRIKWVDSVYTFQQYLFEDGLLNIILEEDRVCGYFFSCEKKFTFLTIFKPITFNQTTVQEISIADPTSYEFTGSSSRLFNGIPETLTSNSICRVVHTQCNPNSLYPNCTSYISNNCIYEEEDIMKSKSPIKSILCCDSYESLKYILENYILTFNDYFNDQ